MARMGNFNMSGFKKLQENINKLQEQNIDAFVESCAKELAARLLARVIKRTPVGQYGKSYVTDTEGNHVRYKTGRNKGKVKRATVKTGGTLRRGWTSQKGSGSEGLNTRSASQFIDTLKVNHYGNTYVIEIVNPVEYASYVEYGHRTPNHKGWVKGHFMMTISEQEIQQIAPRVLENKLKKFLGGVFQ